MSNSVNNVKDSKGISDKSLSNGESHKPRIWRIYPNSIFNREQFESAWNSFKDRNYVGVDYDLKDVNLNDFESKEKLKEYMIKLYDNPNIRSYNQVWDFAHSMKVNDIIIASGASNEILGVGIVESEYVPLKENENANYYIHPQIRKVKWIKTERKNISFKYKNVANVAFEEIDYKIWKKIKEEYCEGNKILEKTNSNLLKQEIKKYTKEDFLEDIVFQEKEYDELVNLIKRKKNIILEGAPGVGKSFIAKKLAWSIMRFEDEERVEFVQFHQSYSYEDFIQGYRPNEDGNGFELNEGVFYSFVNKAKEDQGRDYYFIIDEINRGNISKIFGELLMLIEEDKRGEGFAINLTYSKNNSKFFIPKNLYIIGMMNTADRSLAIIDYALRRRFVFYTINPLFGEETEDIFKNYLLKIDVNNDLASKIISKFRSLNETISKDSDLGEGFRIGHSYFCSKEGNDKEWYESIIKYEIKPLLKEYWFDDLIKVDKEIETLLDIPNIEVNYTFVNGIEDKDNLRKNFIEWYKPQMPPS